MGAAFAVVVVFHLKLEDNWPLLIVIGSAVYPMSKIKKYWIIKDRGGAFVDLDEVNESSITLSFSNPSAFEKVSAAIDE